MEMTRLIVFVFAGIIELLAWLFLVAGMYAAYYFIPDGIFQHEFYQNREILKLAIGLLGTFFLEVILFGPVLVLWDIRKSLKVIEVK
ncbi:MAG: hypothetical protein RKO66_20385 [Candidatus Contendobacter sp.]|nr:hypothetical protein [Candidatus Contendobacter sp.]MDS4058173.1 hypothetical protein [Candidatus Contendobacter sp.]